MIPSADSITCKIFKIAEKRSRRVKISYEFRREDSKRQSLNKNRLMVRIINVDERLFCRICNEQKRVYAPLFL